MKRKGITIFLLGVILIANLACGLSATSEPQPTAAPSAEMPPVIQPPTAVPTAAAQPSPTPDGVAVVANGIEFVIPTGLGSGAKVATVAEVVENAEAPGWDVAPAHQRFDLQGYPLSGAQLVFQPVIRVYPAQDYARVNLGAAKSLEKLYAILTPPFAALSRENMPTLAVNAGLAMASNMKKLDFRSGAGVRMLAFYTQGYAPVTNSFLFYNFHGITTDGKYSIVAILPVSAPFLQEDYDAPLPPDGDPFPEDAAAIPAYLEQIAARLEAAEAQGALTPALAALDALIASLRLTSAGVILPTPLPVALEQPQPSATVAPAASPASCNDAADFIQDVTIPDGTVFKPNERFTKTWRIKNAGTCTWTPDYRLAFKSGDLLGGEKEVPLTAGNTVAPGAFVDVSVALQAPPDNGSYTGFWAIRDAAGRFLPIAHTEKDQFYVQINVGALGFQVTKASIRYTYVSGPIGQLCTWAQYTLYATVTANGTGDVAYQWVETGSGAILQSGVLSFGGASTQIVEIVLSGPFSVPTNMTIAFATDKPDRQWSPVKITCTKD